MKDKIIEQLKKCIYYDDKEYYFENDEYDKTLKCFISFNIPYNDLNKLLLFCNSNDLCLEYCNERLLISEY